MSRRSSTLGQLKILVAILVLSNIALGAFGFYFLRATDRKYSELIGQAVPTLNDMQAVTTTGMDAMRSVNPILFNDSAKVAEMAQRARTALDRDRALRIAVLKRRWLSTDAKERLDFQEAGDNFSEQASGLIPLLESGKNVEAGVQRDKVVRPAFDQYIAATTRATDVLQAQSLRTSDMLSARTGSISEIILGFAGWPFVALGLLIVAAIVIVLLIRIFLFGQNQESAT